MGNLSEKQLFIILIAVALLVAAGFGALGVMDFFSIQEKKEKVQSLREEMRKFDAKARKVKDLDEQLKAMRKADEENLKALPNDRFENALLEGIFAQAQAPAHKVKVVSVEFIQERATGRSSSKSTPWDSYEIKLKAEGSFFNLLKFVNRLEYYPRFLSIEKGKFTAAPVSLAKEEDPLALEQKTGPSLTLDLTIKAFLSKAVTPPKSAPAQAKGAAAAKQPKPADAKQGQPAGEKTPAGPEQPATPAQVAVIYTTYPEKYTIENAENRRNPFEIWLEVKQKKETNGPKPKTPNPEPEQDKKIKEWTERIKALNTSVLQGGEDRVNYKKWKDLIKEIKEAQLTGDRDIKKAELLGQLQSLQEPIMDGYQAHLKGSASDAFKRMKELVEEGSKLQVLGLFEELLEDLYIWDPPVPERALKEFQMCQGIYLQTLESFVEQDGEYAQVIAEIELLNKTLPDKWKRDSFLVELLARTGEIREKAQALMEFYKFEILVSGILWMPYSDRRLAIVNDSAILEGKPVPIKKGASTPKGEEPAPVLLETVGNEQYVWFKYKGLKIKYQIGSAGKKKKP